MAVFLYVLNFPHCTGSRPKCPAVSKSASKNARSSSPKPAPPPAFPVSINSTATLPVPGAPNLRVIFHSCPHWTGSQVPPLLTLPSLFPSLILTATTQSAGLSPMQPLSSTMRLGRTWVCAQPPLLTRCVTLRKLLKFSELSFLSCKTRIVIKAPTSWSIA